MSAFRIDRARVIELREQGHSQRAIADILECAQSRVCDILKEAQTPITHAGAHRDAPEGYIVRGVSSLVDETGAVRLQWVKTAVDPEQQRKMFEAACRAMAEQLEPLPASSPPADVLENLCTLYTITDYHLGMLAWQRETGEAWDLKIAENMLVDLMSRMVASAPPSKVGILNQLGDFLHFDSMLPVTPTNNHILDADTRFQKLVEVAIRVLRRVVDMVLAKHEQVVIYMHEGNHDMASSVWLRVMFAELYKNDPRVTVEKSPLPYTAYEWGKTLIGFHHGHMAKNASLPQIFAARFREAWGRCPKVYIHVGHRHHVDEKEHPGCKVIQHSTMAAADAYSARGGWFSERQAVCITYHKQFGEYTRSVFTPDMLEAAA